MVKSITQRLLAMSPSTSTLREILQLFTCNTQSIFTSSQPTFIQAYADFMCYDYSQLVAEVTILRNMHTNAAHNNNVTSLRKWVKSVGFTELAFD